MRPYNMISGNQTWQNALLLQQKQPLFTFEIPDFGIVLASFTTAIQAFSGRSGYGVVLYGVDGYGT